jgi:hypothetical protein
MSTVADFKKASNPKDALGTRKVPLLSVLPLNVIAAVALGMMEGALKYARHNYRIVGVRASVYVDAASRHLAQFYEGQDLDPDSKAGLHHIDKAIASLVVLSDSIKLGNWVDDRPPRLPDTWIDGVNKTASALVDMFPDPKQPCTQVAADAGEYTGRTES